MMDALEEIRGRWQAATPGPWEVETDSGWEAEYGQPEWCFDSVGPIAVCRESQKDPHALADDVCAIAHAPTDVARLLAAVEGVLGLHVKITHHFASPPAGSVDVCNACRESYPCTTVEAIAKALGGSL